MTNKLQSILTISLSVIIASVCLLLLSCAGPRIKVPEPEPYEGPVDVEALKEHRVLHGVSSLRSEVRVKISRGKKKLGTFKGALLYHEPDNFRLRVYSPFGSAGADIFHADGLIQALVPENGVLYEGRSPATDVELDFRMDENDEYYTLMALKPEQWATRIHASYSFDKRTLQNKAITIYDGGEKFAKMQFRDFIGAVPLRAKVDLMSGYDLYLYLIDPQIDVEISPEYFEPVSHDGLEVLPLERILTEGR